MRESESLDNNQNSILIEKSNDINISNNLNENKDLPNIINNFKFSINSWGNFIIEPDLYYQNKYYFFNLNEFKEKLNENLIDILDRYPYMFQPYRDDLISYSTKNLEDKPFERRPKNFFEIFKRGYYFHKNPNEKNLIEKNKAIILATIIHKINLNNFQNYFLGDYYIGIIDYNPNGADIDFLYYPFSQYIIDEIKDLDSYEKNNDNDTYIKELYEKMKKLKNKIESFSKEKKEKYILINYLFKIIVQKLNVKKDLYNRRILKKETEKIMYEICDSINASILEGLESKRNSNILFKNIEFTDISIKIIKNVSNEKEIFIF